MTKQITMPNAPATRRQTWMLFCLTKRDYRGDGLTVQQASDLIDQLMKDSKKPAAQKGAADFGAILALARKAGLAAGNASKPTPMVVYEADGLSNRPKPGGQVWHESEGVCGFAWIVVNPARGAFINYCRKHKIGRKEYGGGWCVEWVHDFNQSMQRKEAYARAYAEVLRAHGINASTRSRMD